MTLPFQILRNDNPELPFKSFIGDFIQSDLTVFNRNIVTHWKPVMLVSKTLVQYLLYIMIQRSGTGNWYLHLRSFSPDSMLDKIKAKLTIFKSGPVPDSSSFSFMGGVVSNKLTNTEMLKTGKYLFLDDHQMKTLRTMDTIFEYMVEVTVEKLQTQQKGSLTEKVNKAKRPREEEFL
jgi:hypothetical protein